MRKSRPIVIDGDIARIPLTMGYEAIIDAADVPLIKGNWCARVRSHAVYAGRNQGDGQIVYLHRLLMQAPPRLLVDHIDSDGLNNRRSNLRLATPAQNVWNQRRQGLKGVIFEKRRQKWRASISANGRVYWLGYHETAEQASAAYCAAAERLHGEFARVA